MIYKLKYLIFLFILNACISPREDCISEQNKDICFVMKVLQWDCEIMVQQGIATQTECDNFNRTAISACIMSINEKNHCKKESDLPIIPKIVLNHSVPLKLSKFSQTNYNQTSMLVNKLCIDNGYSYIR